MCEEGRSSFLVTLQGCRLIDCNITIKWTPSQVFFNSILPPPPAPLQSSPCIYLRPPIKFRWATSPLMHSPSMFATPVGKSTSGLNQASYLGLILVGGLGTCVCGTPCLVPWVLGCSRKNPKKGWVDDIYTFLKKPLGFIYLSLYP